MNSQPVAIIDAGTTNIKALAVDPDLKILWRSSRSVAKQNPQPGWAEQDAMAIWRQVTSLLDELREFYPATSKLGLTNQRESVVMWDKTSSQPLYPAILWEDSRTADICQQLAADPGTVQAIKAATGLMISPYFSATKLQWLVENLRPNLSRVAAGTIDSWLLFKLTGRHATDYTNASRTQLFNIKTLQWDERLCRIFKLPKSILPSVHPSQYNFGRVIGQNLEIGAVVGDQQASLYAAGDQSDTVKVTYGTGIFPMKLLGDKFQLENGFSTTLAVSPASHPQFALEAKVDGAAARVTPILHDPVKLPIVMQALAAETNPILKQLVKPGQTIIVDGGISQNDDLIHFLEQMSGVKIQRQTDHDGTAIGVAKLLLGK